MAAICQACRATTCAKLRAEQTKIDQFIAVDFPAASAAYDPPDKRVAPAGFRKVDGDDLKRLNLSTDMLEAPVDPKTGKPSGFRAAVFVKDNPYEVVVGFKGSDNPVEAIWNKASRDDWVNNGQQAVGRDSFYYSQAQRIASNIAASGNKAHYVGHSLGGGLAAAAAGISGSTATTFNAAALSKATIDKMNDGICRLPADIDAVSVAGEVLTSGQNLAKMPAQGTNRYVLDPPPGMADAVVAGAALLGPKAVAAAMLARSVALHLRDPVDKSLKRRQDQIVKEMKKNGC
jgi:hypothetical protein